jgi:hypothetical protein
VTDRGQAISLVEAALKSGRIVQADHDMRIDQIKNAPSEQDIDMIVRDLAGHQHHGGPDSQWAQGAAAGPVGAPTPTSGQPWPLVNYGPGAGQPASADIAALTKTGGKALGGVIAVVVLLAVIVPIVGVVIGLATARDTFDEINFGQPVDETTYLPGQEPGDNGVNVHTVDGYEDLVSALEEETGSTEVFSAVLYPRYAVLYVPDDATSRRYEYYYWDGETLEPNDSKATSDDPRIDLELVDPQVFITLLEDVRGRIEDPNSWYVSIDSIATDGPRLAVYASNEYGEGAYVLATLDGTITYESSYE